MELQRGGDQDLTKGRSAAIVFMTGSLGGLYLENNEGQRALWDIKRRANRIGVQLRKVDNQGKGANKHIYCLQPQRVGDRKTMK